MSTLEKKLDALIAQHDHIQPEDVTLEHIRDQRKTDKSYDNAKDVYKRQT